VTFTASPGSTAYTDVSTLLEETRGGAGTRSSSKAAHALSVW